MYLTRMHLNPTRIATKRLITSPHVAHALIEGSFPPGSSGRRLWRIDRRGPELDLYIVSPQPPDLIGVVEQAGWPTTPPTEQPWQTKAYQPFLDRLDTGQRWRFRLTANPTTSIRTTPTARGRTRPLRTLTQQQTWLLHRAERNGFTIPTTSTGAPEIAITNRSQDDFTRRSERDGQPRSDRVEITRVTYEGLLDITDPDTLRTTLTTGIGRAKGYGCGLLTLARWQ